MTLRSLPAFGMVAAASLVAAQFAPSVTHAAGSSTSDRDAEAASRKGSGPDERTTLETCAAYYGGSKVAVGFFHDVATNDGSFNRIKSGGRRELEYRIEDLSQNCVVADATVLVGSADEVRCDNPSDVIQSGVGTFTTPEYEEDERHFEQYWTAPNGKNRCYRVTINSLTALFRSK